MISRKDAKAAKTSHVLFTTAGTPVLGCPEGATFSGPSPRKSVVSSRAKSENSSLRISGSQQIEYTLNRVIGLVEFGFDLAFGLEGFVRTVMEQ
jgi:hypothetical protein